MVCVNLVERGRSKGGDLLFDMLGWILYPLSGSFSPPELVFCSAGGGSLLNGELAGSCSCCGVRYCISWPAGRVAALGSPGHSSAGDSDIWAVWARRGSE